MVSSAVGAITSSDLSAKRAACVRKPAGEASFSYNVALSAAISSAVTRSCALATWAKTQKEIPIERVTKGQKVGRQNRGDDSRQKLSLHLDPCHVLGKVSGVGFAGDDSIACLGERGGMYL
jgi:hypothetical protein